MHTEFDPTPRHRRSIRLKEYNYNHAGAYFVTICTQNRECLFGDIADGKIVLNDFGRIVLEFWNGLTERFLEIELDAFVVMPNHIHGIILITGAVDANGVGAIHTCPGGRCQGELPLRAKRRAMLLPKIVGYFKMNSGKRVNEIRSSPGARVWQRNYYEHIIRNSIELERIRKYIVENPSNWELDDEHPEG